MGQAASQDDVVMAPSNEPGSNPQAAQVPPEGPDAPKDAQGAPVSPLPSEESFGNIVPTSFAWAFGGSSVSVTGSWDNWKEQVQMMRTTGGFTTLINVPVGTYQYKFIVDGNWRHAPVADVERDEHGNLNNIVHVKPHVPEYDSNEPPGGIERPPSPAESYDYSMPPHDDYSVEPPSLPPLFRTAPLSEPSEENSTRTIRHVALNHLFVPSNEPVDPDIGTIATVERFKDDKFVTTILITNAKRKRNVEVGLKRMQERARRAEKMKQEYQRHHEENSQPTEAHRTSMQADANIRSGPGLPGIATAPQQADAQQNSGAGHEGR